MEGEKQGREEKNERGWREEKRKRERRGVVPHPKQKSGCATD